LSKGGLLKLKLGGSVEGIGKFDAAGAKKEGPHRAGLNQIRKKQGRVFNERWRRGLENGVRVCTRRDACKCQGVHINEGKN